MIVIFDLDDTLYPEITYVESGLRHVADVAAARWGVSSTWALEVLRASLDARGRGCQFDDLATAMGVHSRANVQWLLGTYRLHDPDITLPALSDEVLCALSGHALYLVTDGHKVVQAKKVTALGLWDRFRHCYLTNRYGVRHQKPSPHVFELLLRREAGAAPADAVYVGDNPRKDFRGIRPMGFRTVRVRTGAHREVEVPPSDDAEISISSLDGLLPALGLR